LRVAGAAVSARKDLTALTRRLANRGLYSRFKHFFEKKYDVVFVSTGGIADCAWFPDLIAEISRTAVPLVFFIQSNAEGVVHEEPVRARLRDIYERAALMIFLSEHNHRLAERQLGWRFPNFRILMNPLREPLGHPLPWPDADDGQVRFAEVARLEVGDKRQDQLLEALSATEWQDRNWTLTFFGSGPDEGHIRRLIEFYGLQERAKIGGFVADFNEIWRQHHLHILTSHKEGMPLSLIESMACGRPAVVTRAGGNAELIRDNREGFVSPGMHPEVIRETLERAWSQRERWPEMGQAAFARADQVVPKDWAAQMLALLQSAATKGNLK
jgi:glycosyltransferase involved in cell wall biosynthesis